jgi:hypothetical protein
MITTWSKEELRRIAEADDLHISPFREDGVTYGTPTWIWSVAVESVLYVRAYNGLKSRWYQAAVRQKAGRIIAAGMTKEVTFEAVDGPINDRIDDAYRAKYHDSPYLSPMIGARARAGQALIWLAPYSGQAIVWGSGHRVRLLARLPRLRRGSSPSRGTSKPRPRHGSLHSVPRLGARTRQPRTRTGRERDRSGRGLPSQHPHGALRCGYRLTAPECPVAPYHKEIKL